MKDNWNRYQKYATVNITKKLTQMAKKVEVDIKQKVDDQLLQTYKEQVILSYQPRSEAGQAVAAYNAQKKQEEKDDYEQYGIKSRRSRKKLTYKHTNTLVDSVYTVQTDHSVKVMIRDTEYENSISGRKSTAEVYKYLTEGTTGGGYYPYKNDKGEITYAYNYPTPEHKFEETTKVLMTGYLESLKHDIEHKYTKKKG